MTGGINIVPGRDPGALTVGHDDAVQDVDCGFGPLSGCRYAMVYIWISAWVGGWMSEMDGQTKQRLKGWLSVDKDSQDEWVGENYSVIFIYIMVFVSERRRVICFWSLDRDIVSSRETLISTLKHLRPNDRHPTAPEEWKKKKYMKNDNTDKEGKQKKKTKKKKTKIPAASATQG